MARVKESNVYIKLLSFFMLTINLSIFMIILFLLII